MKQEQLVDRWFYWIGTKDEKTIGQWFANGIPHFQIIGCDEPIKINRDIFEEHILGPVCLFIHPEEK